MVCAYVTTNLHIDVAACCIGVRADDVGFLHQGFHLLARQARHADLQLDFDAEAGGDLADADATLDRGRSRQGDLLLAGDILQCAQEIGRVAGGEQLLRVGSSLAGARPSRAERLASRRARCPREPRGRHGRR